MKLLNFSRLVLALALALGGMHGAAQAQSPSHEIALQTGTLIQGESKNFPLAVGHGAHKLLITVTAVNSTGVRIQLPDGRLLSRNDAGVNVTLEKTAVTYEVTSPQGGEWHVGMSGVGDFSVSASVLDAAPEPAAHPVPARAGNSRMLGTIVPIPPVKGLRAVPGTMITTGTAISEDGKPVVWGFRGSAQQGNGRTVVPSFHAPAEVESLENIVDFVGGAYHLVARDDAGNVYGWGQSGYGESGCLFGYAHTPCLVLKDATQIAVGEYFSMALDVTGQVWTWGHNAYGQLGIKKFAPNSFTPRKVNLGGERARLVGAAYEGAFAVTQEGHVWAWGDNEASGLGVQGTNYGVQQIVWEPVRVDRLTPYAHRIVSIAGGNGWGEALLDDGEVIGWGLHAALGQGTERTNISSPDPVHIMHGVKKLFARYVGSVALTEEGDIYTWGQTGGSAFEIIYGAQPTLRQPADQVHDIGGGKEHVFYTTVEGRLYGVGYNDLNKLDQTRCCGPNVDWPGAEIDF